MDHDADSEGDYGDDDDDDDDEENEPSPAQPQHYEPIPRLTISLRGISSRDQRKGKIG